VERPEDFEPVRLKGSQRQSMGSPQTSDKKAEASSQDTSTGSRDDRQLLNKHAVEKMTSLDITTIYRKMAAGKFPQPVRIGRRRVAWRTTDIVRWQQDLEVGTETLRWRNRRTREENRGRQTRDPKG
jgi:prophage regulatory protein